MLGWTRSQRDALRQIEMSPDVAIWSIVIDDGQRAWQLVEIVTGKSPSLTDSDPDRSVPAFRLSEGYYSGPFLVEQLRQLIATASWIVIYAGGTRCAPELVELMQYLDGQNFDEPRFLVIVDAMDLECATTELQTLVHLGRLIDLTAHRDSEYYWELIADNDLPPPLARTLAEFHHQVAALEGSRSIPFTTRNLNRAAHRLAAKDPITLAVEMEYLGGLNPDDSMHATVAGIYRRMFGHEPT